MSSGSNDTTIWKLKKVKAIGPISDDAVKSLARMKLHLRRLNANEARVDFVVEARGVIWTPNDRKLQQKD